MGDDAARFRRAGVRELASGRETTRAPGGRRDRIAGVIFWQAALKGGLFLSCGQSLNPWVKFTL